MQELLENLTIVSTIEVNQKLCTYGATFTVHRDSMWGSLTRRWYGEDRLRNLNRLQDLYTLAMLRCELIELQAAERAVADRILRFVRTSLPGLENLATTYAEDSTVQSKLRVLIDNVSEFLAVRNIRTIEP
jgi:hypothetical protein